MTGRLAFGPGVTLELSEADYLYGTGTLALRVTRVDDLEQVPRLEWVTVYGCEVYPSDRLGPVRVALVRVTAIPRALRPGRWLPPNYASTSHSRPRLAGGW